MKFYEKLTTLRKGAGMSQEELAEKLEVSRQAVSRWEAGNTLPDAGNLLRLSDLFSVSVDALLRDEHPLNDPTETAGQGQDSDVSAKEPIMKPESPKPPQAAAQNRRKRDRYIALAVLCFFGALLLTAVCFGVRMVTGVGILLIFLLPVFAACMFGTGFFVVKAARQNVGQGLEPANPRKRDKLIIAMAAFFLAGIVFLATGWVYWNFIIGGLWLMWLHLILGAGCLFASCFCGFRLYVLLHSKTEEDKTQAQAKLAMVTAVLNLISAVCFSFAGGLSDIWFYWLAAALLMVSSMGEFARWRKLKYGK